MELRPHGGLDIQHLVTIMDISFTYSEDNNQFQQAADAMAISTCSGDPVCGQLRNQGNLAEEGILKGKPPGRLFGPG